jgi:hypothetical protein
LGRADDGVGDRHREANLERARMPMMGYRGASWFHRAYDLANTTAMTKIAIAMRYHAKG